MLAAAPQSAPISSSLSAPTAVVSLLPVHSEACVTEPAAHMHDMLVLLFDTGVLHAYR
jgi:hypothetical protein